MFIYIVPVKMLPKFTSRLILVVAGRLLLTEPGHIQEGGRSTVEQSEERMSECMLLSS